MSKIWFTSDLHFCHDRGFIFEPRGFENVESHNEEIVRKWNEVVADEDTVYVLGDIMLNDNVKGIELFNQLKGMKKIIIGNHDTSTRVALYGACPNTIVLGYADVIKYKGYHFYLSHYPTLTSNLEKESLKQCMINLFGHTHQQINFHNDIPFMYHVGVDSHDCYPVDIDTIIEDCKAKVSECEEML